MREWLQIQRDDGLTEYIMDLPPGTYTDLHPGECCANCVHYKAAVGDGSKCTGGKCTSIRSRYFDHYVKGYRWCRMWYLGRRKWK